MSIYRLQQFHSSPNFASRSNRRRLRYATRYEKVISDTFVFVHWAHPRDPHLLLHRLPLLVEAIFFHHTKLLISERGKAPAKSDSCTCLVVELLPLPELARKHQLIGINLTARIAVIHVEVELSSFACWKPLSSMFASSLVPEFVSSVRTGGSS